MRSHLGLLFSALVLGCGDSGENTTTTATSGPLTTSASASGTDTTETSTDTEGDPHAVCERYIACVDEVHPTGLTQAEEGFGADSECWKMDQEQIDLCLEVCRGELEKFHVEYPDEPKCNVCEVDSECDQAAGEHCFDGRCIVGQCGDGLVQAGELCDGQEECSGDCLGGDTCSPLTNVGCAASQLCQLYWNFGTGYFEKCDDVVSNPCADQACVAGEYCRYEGETQIGCAPYCDLNAPPSCPDGLSCVPVTTGDIFFPPEAALSYLGKCA